MKKLFFVIRVLSRDLGFVLLYPVVAFWPRDEKKILFGAWGGRQFSDNPMYFMKYLQRQNKGYRCYWVGESTLREQVERAVGVAFVRKGSFLAIWHILSARWMCCNIRIATDITHFPTYGRIKQINFWHGTTFKSLPAGMFSAERSKHVGIVRRFWRFLAYGMFDWACPQKSYATFSSKDMCEKMTHVAPWSFSVERSIPCGSPRIDYLIRTSQNMEELRRLRERIAAVLKIPTDKRWYLYMPTWRNGLDVSFSFLNSARLSDYQRVLAEQNAILIEKQHPQVLRALGLGSAADGNIRVVSEAEAAQLNVQELLLTADRLITDYSSCFCDYAPLKRPVIHWAYDYNRYVSDERSGDDYPLKDYSAGPVAETDDELIASLGQTDEQLLKGCGKRFCELIEGETGHACEQFAAWMRM